MSKYYLHLLEQGRNEEVERRLAKKKRSSLESVLYAVALSNQGKLELAEKEYIALLTREPGNFDALNNLGNIYLKRNALQRAVEYFGRAADAGHQEPFHLARAYVNTGVAARQLEQSDLELSSLEKAVQIAPNMSLALRALGVRYIADKRVEEAITLLQRAVTAEPRDIEAWANLSAAHMRAKDYEKAADAARQALLVNPGYAIAKANLGIALNSLERYEEAKDYLLQAHQAKLNYHNVYQALAQVSLNLEEEYEEARQWCEIALRMAPDDPTVIRTMGDIVARQNRLASLKWFERAMALDPEDVLTHWNASLNYLANGEFERGWSEYEWGFKQEKMGRGQVMDFGCPVWMGESLMDKSIVIWGEQGVGDIVMFAHALNEIANEARLVCLLIPGRLAIPFERSYPNITVMPYEAYQKLMESGKRFDYHSAIASTLRWKRKSRADFAGKVPYLKPDPSGIVELMQKYRERGKGRPIIGIAWKAGHYTLAKRKKTVNLEKLLPVLKSVDATWVSLQYGDVAQELAEFNRTYGTEIIYDDTIDGLRDIDTWFAQICACDMVVSVATAAVHFAGAAGRRVKVLVPRGGNFNWQETDTRSLWYPQVEIFRQNKRGNWEEPIAELAQSLAAEFNVEQLHRPGSVTAQKKTMPAIAADPAREEKNSATAEPVIISGAQRPKVVCIIPARGGSKGLARKNIRQVWGHPLVAWPIAAARACKLIDHVILTTDDPEMAAAGRRYGAETPFLRPAEVSADSTTTEDTLRYSLLETEKALGKQFDIAVFLTATDFFRLPGWVDQVVAALIEDSLLESAFVANRTHKNFWEKQPDGGNGEWGRLRDWMKLYSNRQVRVPVYREDTGLACASRAQLWRDGRRIGDRVKIIEADYTQCSLDIHDEFDLFLVEQALSWLARHRPEQLPPVPVPVAAEVVS